MTNDDERNDHGSTLEKLGLILGYMTDILPNGKISVSLRKDQPIAIFEYERSGAITAAFAIQGYMIDGTCRDHLYSLALGFLRTYCREEIVERPSVKK